MRLPFTFHARRREKDIGRAQENEGDLHWQVMGGNNKNRIGMNSGLCSYNEKDDDGKTVSRNILFDVGTLTGDTRCPEDPVLQDFDIVIPDISRFLEKPDDPSHKPEKVLDAIFLTHSHSDHIGAIPFLMRLGYRLPPIYATPYTARRLQQEMEEMGFDETEWPEISIIAPGMPVKVGPVDVSAFWVSHSTPQSVGFFIETPAGNILSPGDFKLDQSVVWGPAFSTTQFNKLIAGKSIDLMLMDSTGADHDVAPVREEDVRETLRDLMDQNPDKRFIVAVMSGFEENLASVAKVTAEHDRTLWVAGASHERALKALEMTGMTLSDSIGEDVEVRTLTGARAVRDLAAQQAGKSVVVVTGAQGKPYAALTRAAEGLHGSLILNPKTDIVLFCAPTIPGQEGYRQRLLNLLHGQGIQTLTRKEAPLYSQAHARRCEIVEMANMAKARVFLPAHGDTELRGSCADVLRKEGHTVINAENGADIRVTKTGCIATPLPDHLRAPLLGFKTMQGATWRDRNYAMMEVPAEISATAVPEKTTGRKKPGIFRVQPK